MRKGSATLRCPLWIVEMVGCCGFLFSRGDFARRRELAAIDAE